MPNTRLHWSRSVAVKSFAIAFVATHVPLLALIALVVLRPDWLSPVSVLLAALGATLLAAILVIAALWRLFRPLRLAADGLRSFMTRGQPLRLSAGAQDEVGRLVQVLVLALAHLDRQRAPLLQAGALVLQRKSMVFEPDGAGQSLVLVEIDQWQALDQSANILRMQDVQIAMNRMLATVVHKGEAVLPWGRGRFLLALDVPTTDAFDRLEVVSGGFQVGDLPERFTCSAAVEPRSPDTGVWAATLQRLEHKLFTLRLEGRAAAVV